ncbi:hypothetical protein Cni_G02341 [Canna indica]|uniref:Uncharacterized protein n=1 Tax=Canna indica TaxID=4628 RepID=A0AAQ3JRZ6_9LILI|nr:hypothetical protein Cni_G02341 [Canna indica]
MVEWTKLLELFSIVAFASPLVQSLAEKAAEAGLCGLKRAFSSVDAFLSVKADLENLSSTAQRIRSQLNDAEEIRVITDESVRGWLSDLKDVALEIDDLVNEFQTRQNILELERVPLPDGSRKRKRPWDSLPCRTFLLSLRTSRKIKEIQGKFDEIRKKREDFQFREHEAVRRQQDREEEQILPPSGSLSGNPLVLGLDEQKNKILTLLTEGSGGTGVTVIAIVGPGGIGKTSLARLVFYDEQVKRSSFFKIWVGVSSGFTVERVTKEIIEAITGKRSDSLSLDLLQLQLQKLLAERKFLLVLDGLWSENHLYWETLQAPLMNGEVGSSVLITARNQLVLAYMRPSTTIELNGLGSDESWSLFCNYAFKTQDGDPPTNLQQIGRQIVNRCQGSPLAIVFIGGHLYSKRVEEWNNILRDIRDPQDTTHSVLDTLKVSYSYLPLFLKKCFAFCSIFPSGYEFDMEELVRLWVAVGLVKSSYCRTEEYIGYKYFKYLLWRSFFQKSDGCYHDRRQKYKMPGLIHELAESVLAQSVYSHECLRIENDETHFESEKALYACSVSKQFSTFQKIYQHKRLRAFILLSQNLSLTRQVLDDHFHNLSCLRVLDLRKNELSELPDSICNLIHLRYLNLYGTKIKRLPESMCDLYNLLYLEVGDCNSLEELPKGMFKLTNLRYLGLHLDWERYRDNWPDLIGMPPGIGRLTDLQVLSRFSVSSESGLAELRELKLQGEICISKLENVVDARDAQKANLSDKEHIESLMLRWTTSPDTSSQDITVAEEVIEQLSPHSNLKYLWIDKYNGARFPSWLEDDSLNLETLRLSNCERCDKLPPLGMLKKLKYLYLEGLHAVESVDSLFGSSSGFPLLEKLSISNMNNLEKGFEIVQGGMPYLKELVLSECPKLHELPQVPNLLEICNITNCPILLTTPTS